MKTRFYAAMLLLMTFVAQADVLHLKNGNRMEGVIRSETATAYQLDIGFGTVTIPQAQVVKVERASAAAQKQLEQERQRKYVLHEDYAPVDLQDLLPTLQAVEAQRTTALQSRQTLATLQQAMKNTGRELQQLQAEAVRASHQLTPLPPNPTRAAMESYNHAVDDLNSIRTRMLTLTANPVEKLNAMDQCRRNIAQYITTLFAFVDRVHARQQHGSGNDSPQLVADFFSELDARLKTYQGEVTQIRLPYQADKRQVVVKAKLNNQVEGLFIVDTGATTMTISEEMARQLNIPKNPREEKISLADGSTRAMHSVVLGVVEVEGARVNNVAAVVTPNPPADGVDGLLGMSFLMEFNIQLDPATHALTLNRFAPH